MAALIPRPNYPPYGGGEDAGRQEVDKILTETEKKVHKIYLQAAQEMRRKADDYLREFRQADREKLLQVMEGKLSQKEYEQWRYSHILTGRRWYEMSEVLATDMTNSNLIAANIINKSLPDVFASGYNYGLYQGEIGGGFRTSFTIYNRDAVERLIAEEPDLLPVQAKLKVPEDIRWNKKQINSVMTQALLQGDTLEKCATRMASSVAGMNERTAVRNARTACTSAENGGLYNAYRRLQSAGVDMTVEWASTLDGRTRHTHRLLDGQRRNVDEPFEVDGQKILYAGDPYAPQGLIWNCRCKIRGWVKGFEESRELRAEAFPTGEYESYTDWKFAKEKEAEERKERPRVNPDNPSYGHAADFHTTETVRGNTKRYNSEQIHPREDFTSGGSRGIIKSITVDDFELRTYGKGLDERVEKTLHDEIKGIEKRSGVTISDILIEDIPPTQKGHEAIITEMMPNGLIRMTFNSRVFAGKTLEDIDERFANTDEIAADNLHEAMVHELGHLRVMKGLTPKQASRVFEALKKKPVKGISAYGDTDGAETISEVEVLLERGLEVPKEALALYKRYTRRK